MSTFGVNIRNLAIVQAWLKMSTGTPGSPFQRHRPSLGEVEPQRSLYAPSASCQCETLHILFQVQGKGTNLTLGHAFGDRLRHNPSYETVSTARSTTFYRKIASSLTPKDSIHGFTSGAYTMNPSSPFLYLDTGSKGRTLMVKFAELTARS